MTSTLETQESRGILEKAFKPSNNFKVREPNTFETEEI